MMRHPKPKMIPTSAAPAARVASLAERSAARHLRRQSGSGEIDACQVWPIAAHLAGEMVFIIDPHSNGWFELPGVGGGEDWPMVEAAMMAVYAEYKRRLMYRKKHKRETGEELPYDYFPRLTVVFDEANNARAFERIYSGAKRRLDPWPLFAQCLGSGARKVNICVWLLLQSALVEDIGLSGAMRQNFYAVRWTWRRSAKCSTKRKPSGTQPRLWVRSSPPPRRLIARCTCLIARALIARRRHAALR